MHAQSSGSVSGWEPAGFCTSILPAVLADGQLHEIKRLPHQEKDDKVGNEESTCMTKEEGSSAVSLCMIHVSFCTVHRLDLCKVLCEMR